MTPVRILRAFIADVLLAFAAWCREYVAALDTALADACNDPEEDV